jgi:KipI family sensor histidine kinase inhibitor
MRVLPCGDGALLVELDDLPDVLALYDALRREPPPGGREYVPAARTLLVRFDPRVATGDAVRADLARRPRPVAPQGGPGADAGAAPIEVPVHYDGEDLDDVARLTGLSTREVVRRHAGATYTAAFCGFSPGFAYLVGLDPALHVPRRETPRTRVPAGAVAVAGDFSAVYPRESPGGWRILGHTRLAVWDLDREPPTVLEPGRRVRFVQAPP